MITFHRCFPLNAKLKDFLLFELDTNIGKLFYSIESFINQHEIIESAFYHPVKTI